MHVLIQCGLILCMFNLAVCPVMSFIRTIIVSEFCMYDNTFPYGLTIHNFIPLFRSFHDRAVPYNVYSNLDTLMLHMDYSSKLKHILLRYS